MISELKIRPEARTIKSIGEDLIKNPYTAVIEFDQYNYRNMQKTIYRVDEEFLKLTC